MKEVFKEIWSTPGMRGLIVSVAVSVVLVIMIFFYAGSR